jgi:hypothetical protein
MDSRSREAKSLQSNEYNGRQNTTIPHTQKLHTKPCRLLSQRQKYSAFLERVRSAVAKAMAGQGEKNNEADVRLLFSRKEVFPLSPHHLPISGTKLTIKKIIKGVL